ncbi:MAG: hypothetical protein ACRDO7_15255 [Nocardioidaceae bacterium]
MSELFKPYPATPETVWSSGRTLSKTGDPMLEAATAAAKATLPAAANVVEQLFEPVRVLAHPLAGDGSQLSAAAGFAGSAVNAWGIAITVYNTKIAGLNKEYAVAGKSGDNGESQAAEGAPSDQVVADLVRRKNIADDDLNESARDIAAMLGRGPNQKDWNTLGSVGAVSASFATYVEGGKPGEKGGPHFVIGEPTRPKITWDEDFIYDSKDSNWDDHLAKMKWLAMMQGAHVARSDLDDATTLYEHYWENNGEHIEFDYEEAYNEDSAVRANVATEIERAQRGAEALINAGNTNFSMTGDATEISAYPHTENWQKAIGSYQQWSSADVTVEGDKVTMNVTVHAEDYYNFNKGATDLASGAPDNENGRFTEIGWAKPFESSGTVTRTVTWVLGQPGEPEISDDGDPARNPGREDREDERDSGGRDRPVVPDNDPDAGGQRGR